VLALAPHTPLVDHTCDIYSLMLQIYIATPDGQGGYSLPEEPLAWSSPGRTLGVQFDLGADLVIANAPLGLLQVRWQPCCYT